MDIIDLVSDLEEGEIIDDSPSSSNSDHKKTRKLPQRYKFHEKNTPIQKHKKKDCKNSIRYHAKKIAKMKKSPKLKNSSKRHYKSTCSHEKSQKVSEKSTKNVEINFSNNNYPFSNHSLIAEIKYSLKDHFTKSQSTQHNSKTQTDTDNKISNVFELSEICRENVDFQPENNIAYLKKDQAQVNNIKNLVNFDKGKISSGMKFSSNVTFDNGSLTKNEESEDLAELRRIALATCAKRKPIIEQSEKLIQNVNSNHILPVPETLEINNIQISHQESKSPASDNYEVVDMDVDEDTETSIEVLETSVKESIENLYIIDTKPSADLERGIQKNTLSEAQTHNSSDDDFDTDILRAELVGNLCEKKDLEDEYVGEKTNVAMHPKKVPIVTRKKSIGNYKKFSFYRKQLRTVKPISKKIIVNNKCENLNHNINKPTVSAQVNKPPKRLIIALNEESSSEDSDTENPVASIEALISDCRQKSDSNDKTQEAVTHVPLAVSCLSKAQQEEYTSLMKILAKKEKLQGPSNQVQPKNGSVHLPQDDLKLLEEKQLECKEAIKRKMEFMTHLTNETGSNELTYMKSKLTAEHLKEQYIAAEKIRKVNLGVWSKSLSDLRIVKKDVANLESKMNQMQSLYSKLDAMQGHNIK